MVIQLSPRRGTEEEGNTSFHFRSMNQYSKGMKMKEEEGTSISGRTEAGEGREKARRNTKRRREKLNESFRRFGGHLHN